MIAITPEASQLEVSPIGIPIWCAPDANRSFTWGDPQSVVVMHPFRGRVLGVPD